MRTADIFERSAQDDLLVIRNDLMTVYREISADDERLFPLRYARIPGGGSSGARAGARRPVRAAAGRADGPGPSPHASPQAPVLLIPDGPGLASVLPYHLLRHGLAARGLDVIMMEHRGVGLSRLDSTGVDLPAHAMRVREVIGDLIAVLDHARVERATVYGCGYGGYLAQALAALHPDRVHSLVLDSPRTGSDDELIGQRALRDAYWNGAVPATSTTASALRRVLEEELVDPHRAGPVVLAVHEHGGPSAVRDLVDLLVVGRGQLTWNSVRQVLMQEWLQSTPYVAEHDLTAHIAHTELGNGRHADGHLLDALEIDAEQARAVPAFAGEPLDLSALVPAITAPTLVMAGGRDLITPPQIARDLAARIPRASLLEIPDAGHSLLDSRTQIAQVAARWSASDRAHLLPEHARELTALPGVSVGQTLGQGLRLALAVERYSPWRLWMESARRRRVRALVDPTSRRTRKVRIQ